MKKRTSAFGDVIAHGGQCVKGLHKVGDAIGVVANTEAVMTAALDAVCKAQSEYRDAIMASPAVTDAQDVLNDKAGALITLVRDNLKPTLGSRYSEAWGNVGFLSRTLKVPAAMGKRSSVLKAIELFFESHPELEIPNVVTKTMAATLHADFTTAIAAVGFAKVNRREKQAVRDAALAVLRQRITALRNELKPLLAPNDPRWIDFGFDVPTDVHVTSAPEGVKLTVDPVTSHVVASWDDTVHTDRFRVYQRVIGTDTEYKPVDTTTDTSFDLGKFASGAHIDVQVTAINAAGESVPSHTASTVVP